MIWLLLACTPPSLEVVPPEVEEAWPEEELALPALEALPPPVPCSPGEVALSNGVPYPTLTAALDATVSGTVTACPGTHVVNGYVYPHEGPIRVSGGAGGRDVVVLDNQHGGSLADFSGARRGLWVDDLTLLNMGAMGWLDPGLLGPMEGNFLGERLRVADSDGEGSPVALFGPEVVLTDAVFENNLSTWGAAALEVQLDDRRGTRAELLRVQFRNNDSEDRATAAIGGGWGPGPHILDFQDVSFEGNESVGTLVLGSHGRDTWMRLTDCSWRLNQADTRNPLTVENMERNARLVLDRAKFIGNEHNGRIGGAFELEDYYLPPGQVQPNNRSPHVAIVRDLVAWRNFNTGNPGSGVVYGLGWRIRFENADFGVGYNNNFVGDLYGCPDYGAGVTGVVNFRLGDYCP